MQQVLGHWRVVQFFWKHRSVVLFLQAWSLVFLGVAISGYSLYSLSVVSNQLDTCPAVPDLPQQLAQLGRLSIDVNGAVAQPGVYHLSAGQRVADALAAAGGASAAADTRFLTQTLNLSDTLIDGQKIYIPFAGDSEQNSPATHPQSEPPAEEGSGLISLNSASQSELETLPGIGEKRAADIIAGRPYSTIGELESRGIISAAVWSEIAQLIRL